MGGVCGACLLEECQGVATEFAEHGGIQGLGGCLVGLGLDEGTIAPRGVGGVGKVGFSDLKEVWPLLGRGHLGKGRQAWGLLDAELLGAVLSVSEFTGLSSFAVDDVACLSLLPSCLAVLDEHRDDI